MESELNILQKEAINIYLQLYTVKNYKMKNVYKCKLSKFYTQW